MIYNFFNVINFPEGREDEALRAWEAIGRYMEQRQGFLGSTLYQNRENPRLLINKGRYETEEAFLACVRDPEFQKLSQVLTDLGVERTAGLYDEAKSWGEGGN